MASNVMKTPLVRHIVTRGYAQACPAPARLSELKIVTATLHNNAIVSSVDNGSPCTRIAISFKGGARYEPATEPGLIHVLRSSAGLTTKNASEFILKRNLAQLGATVNATVDRELITYTLEVAKVNQREAIKLLNKLISEQEFRQWELDENVNRLKYDIASLPTQIRVVDLLHKAAYRRGLGNSLFISPRRIGKVSSESLQHYTNNYLTEGRMSVAVIGDNQERAVSIANSMLIGSGKADDAAPTKYHGGELRKEMGGDLAHIALAVEGAKAGSAEALALAVAAKALGAGPSVKWGADNSVLAKAIGNIGPFAAAGFNLAYSDSGLFGVVLSVPKDEAQAAVKAVANTLKSGSLPADAIKRGKSALRVQILDEQDQGSNLAESVAMQALAGGVKAPKELAEAVEKLSDSDVNRTLSTVSKAKLSLGAAGSLVNVPYIDEI